MLSVKLTMRAVSKCIVLLCAAVAATSGFNLGPQDVVLHLFNRGNVGTQSQPFFPTMASILDTDFDPAARTVITIHDAKDGVAGNFNAFVVNAELAVADVNVVAIDWSRGAASYTEGVAYATQVGEVVASFINLLESNLGYGAENIRIVGFGLGGHIAGIAARQARATIPHIIALDPSLVGWTHHPNKLSADAAGVVEVLHTTAGILGYDQPLGDLDFYPSGGSFQVPCASDSNCSHLYAYIFYDESLRSEIAGGAKFVGTKCASYEEAIEFMCTGEKDAVFGGSEVKTEASGIYIFSTNSQAPFARG